VKKFDQVISLEQLKREEALKDMLVLKRGMRLSVQPVTVEHYNRIVVMAGR
jgi:predicted RNA-binding protein with PUA-like domain